MRARFPDGSEVAPDGSETRTRTAQSGSNDNFAPYRSYDPPDQLAVMNHGSTCAGRHQLHAGWRQLRRVVSHWPRCEVR